MTTNVKFIHSWFVGHAGLFFRKKTQAPKIWILLSVIYFACGWMSQILPKSHNLSHSYCYQSGLIIHLHCWRFKWDSIENLTKEWTRTGMVEQEDTRYAYPKSGNKREINHERPREFRSFIDMWNIPMVCACFAHDQNRSGCALYSKVVKRSKMSQCDRCRRCQKPK